MRKIILDTNFLLIPAAQKVDIFSEIDRIIEEPYNIFVVDRTIDELNSIIESQAGKHKDAAKLALQLIRQKNISIMETKQKSLYMHINSKDIVVDDILLKISDENTIIATQDAGLKKRLADKGIQTIILRGKKHLEIK
jgi:uncharacterized protein